MDLIFAFYSWKWFLPSSVKWRLKFITAMMTVLCPKSKAHHWQFGNFMAWGMVGIKWPNSLFFSINILQLMKNYHCTVRCWSLGYSNIGNSICILYLFCKAFSRLGGGLSSFGFGGTNAHGVVSCATEADGTGWRAYPVDAGSLKKMSSWRDGPNMSKMIQGWVEKSKKCLRWFIYFFR